MVNFFVVSEAKGTLVETSTSIAENVNVEAGEIQFNPAETTVSAHAYFAILDAAGNQIYDNTGWDGEDLALGQTSEPVIVKHDSENWMVLDQTLRDDGKIVGTTRVMLSMSQIEATMRKLALLLIAAIPIYMAIAVTGSLLIARSALKPIGKITKTAQSFSAQDLSRRVENISTNDEVGELSATINHMLERLEQGFAREKQFSADVSHELRTPVAVILAEAETGLHGQTTPEQQTEALARIVVTSKKMAKIISQMLMLTKNADNQLILNKEHFDLVGVIRDISSEMESVASGYGVEIGPVASGRQEIYADHMMLTQLLINLITNACKYNTAGGCVSIRIVSEGDMINVIVHDTGVGIAEDDLPHIFDRFYRAEKAHSGDGAGLGLSIVKWIVEAHQGQITVTSNLGVGTTFEVRFPRE